MAKKGTETIWDPDRGELGDDQAVEKDAEDGGSDRRDDTKVSGGCGCDGSGCPPDLFAGMLVLVAVFGVRRRWTRWDTPRVF